VATNFCIKPELGGELEEDFGICSHSYALDSFLLVIYHRLEIRGKDQRRGQHTRKGWYELHIIILEDTQAEGRKGIITRYCRSILQDDLDTCGGIRNRFDSRVEPYLAWMEELVCFFLNEGLEPSLVNAHEVLIREATLVCVIREIIILEGQSMMKS